MILTDPNSKSLPVASILDGPRDGLRTEDTEPRIEVSVTDGEQTVKIQGELAFWAIIVVSLAAVLMFVSRRFSPGS